VSGLSGESPETLVRKINTGHVIANATRAVQCSSSLKLLLHFTPSISLPTLDAAGST